MLAQSSGRASTGDWVPRLLQGHRPGHTGRHSPLRSVRSRTLPKSRPASKNKARHIDPGATVACHGRWVHTEYVGRIIGTILGAILAIWLAFTAAGGIFATLKTFLIVGLIAMAVFIVVWLVARRPSGG